MPGESVNIFQVNRRKASERDSTTFNLSVILHDVDYFGGILYGIVQTDLICCAIDCNFSLVSIILGKKRFSDNCAHLSLLMSTGYESTLLTL